jgi:hypothetical protein
LYRGAWKGDPFPSFFANEWGFLVRPVLASWLRRTVSHFGCGARPAKRSEAGEGSDFWENNLKAILPPDQRFKGGVE